jgi:hypothetical protein
MRQKVEAEMAAVARVVLVGKQARIDRPHGYRDDHVVPSWVRAALPVTVVMVPIALAKVVKETDSRIYVEGLTQPDGEGKFEGDYTVVKGSPPNQYVEKDAVMADHATPETARRITGILADFSGSYEAAGSRLESAVKPLLAQETLRIRQAETQMLDMLREALAECAENAGGAAAVESEDDGGGFKP